MQLLREGQWVFVTGVAPGRLSTLQWMPSPHPRWTLWIIKTTTTYMRDGMGQGVRSSSGKLGIEGGDGYDQNNLCETLKELITEYKKAYVQTSLK